ncbi:MAG: type VI secretion system contractile sheath large subunit [Candidatus Manganitrophus sp.]|uniref:Type VI secretion system contractile sheath large subunit n=1 Tax=Candidatus Manganitrophus noduliformans TaxID=2606439 RepID=A0A7X6DSK6_9BACT|nr:type VI secretion system contractile sheath large subunit [Candidatus Manganitrophus noduliformans]MDC4227037.1 type VI secretion system contractile sheath large subunit [Candidatus Manganitrophus sp.]NKE72394.1 type VI secretion system contractile sheath large subunit [Candidatus Manganitrophus noduliformans]WDT71882.1 MAG: type VI secretion system contractile sheath large subunit [Candidatus Manganitrophus sp.]WDT80729.1 MAG: type VI secretion system contractile sheath large subunit [Candi
MAEQTEEKQAGAVETAEGETSLLDTILQETKLKPSEEGYSIAKRGVEAFIAELLTPDRKGAKVHQTVINDMIAEIDRKLSSQVDAIMHHPTFQKIESAWRGLKFAVDRTNFRENIKFELLNVSKEDLLNDFEDAPEITKSGLYKLVYTAEYGTFGGKPVGAMIANYDFGPGPQDVKLLQYAASVGAMAHAPFIAAAGPQFFGQESFLGLPNLKDLKSIFEGPQYIKWNSFRESEDARYVGLTLPRFLLRLPYHPENNPVKAFTYTEDVSKSHESYLWGNTAFAFATRITDSFAKYRWCPNVIGPTSGGAVEDLPVHTFESMGALETKIPTEVLISERREFELAEEGFIGLAMRKGSDNACFFSANSCQKPKYYGQSKEGKEAETNYKLGTQLPYMMIMNRMAHYLKVLQREQIGSWKERVDLEKELNKWIGQYVSDQDVVDPAVRGRRPLRQAEITVSDVEGDPGWYKVDMKVRPHFKYMGSFFTLSLVGKLDKK